MKVKVGSYWRKKDARQLIVRIWDADEQHVITIPVVTTFPLPSLDSYATHPFTIWFEPLNRLEVLVLFGVHIDA